MTTTTGLASLIEGINPSRFYEAVTPSDSVNFTGSGISTSKGPSGDPLCQAIYIGGGGNMVAIRDDNTAITFTGVVAGTIVPIQAKRINSTSTTATSMVALF